MPHPSTPPVKKTGKTDNTVNYLKLCIGSRSPHCSTLKRAGQNPETNYPASIYHQIPTKTSSRYQAFQQLLWKPSEDASQKTFWNHMSLPIYHRRQTPLAQFRQWLMRVTGGWIVRDMETIILLVFLAFGFISQRSHQSLTLTRSLFRDCNWNSNAFWMAQQITKYGIWFHACPKNNSPPKISLLLEFRSTPTMIIKPRLILVVPWLVHNVQTAGTDAGSNARQHWSTNQGVLSSLFIVPWLVHNVRPEGTDARPNARQHWSSNQIKSYPCCTLVRTQRGRSKPLDSSGLSFVPFSFQLHPVII